MSRLRIRSRRGACFVAALILAGCVSDSQPPLPRIATAQFAGRVWIAEDIDGKGVIDRAQSTLEFLDESRVSGSLGCNRYSAPYVANHPAPGNLKIGHVAATRRMCPDAVMNQELRFSAALDATRRAQIDARGILLLMDESGVVRVRLAPASRPAS